MNRPPEEKPDGDKVGSNSISIEEFATIMKEFSDSWRQIHNVDSRGREITPKQKPKTRNGGYTGMKFEWPTELAQRENGDFYERRLTVLEIVMRLALTPIYFTMSWLFRFVEFAVVSFLDSIGEVLMAITRTLEFLERKYSRGKDKREKAFKKTPFETDEPDLEAEIRAEKTAMLRRIRDLILQQRRTEMYWCINAIIIHPRISWLMLEQMLTPQTLYGYPIRMSSEIAADFALEMSIVGDNKEPELITPMDSDYSGTIQK